MRALFKYCLMTLLFINSLNAAPIYGSAQHPHHHEISYQHKHPRPHANLLRTAWTTCLILLAGGHALYSPQATSAQLVTRHPTLLPSQARTPALIHPRERFKGRRLLASSRVDKMDQTDDEAQTDALIEVDADEAAPAPTDSGHCLLLTIPDAIANAESAENGDNAETADSEDASTRADTLVASPVRRSSAAAAAEPLAVQTIDRGIQWKMLRLNTETDEPVRLSYTFDDLMETLYDTRFANIRPLDEDSRDLVREAFEHISEHSSITFYEADKAQAAQANLHFRRADRDNSNVAGYAYLPSPGMRRTVATLLLSHSGLADSSTTIHEILHMLGFGHPHDGTLRLPQEDWADTKWSTVMSYINHRCAGTTYTGPLDNFLLATLHPKAGSGQPVLGSSHAPFCLYKEEKIAIIAGSVVVGTGLVTLVVVLICKKCGKSTAPAALPA